MGTEAALPIESHGGDPERDQHIFEITGIRPDPRAKIPLEETATMIRGTQNGDPQAMERLVASRLVWVYGKYLRQEAVLQRHDLTPADIMQMGSLATLEAAGGINADSPIANTLLHNRIPEIMGHLLLETKLTPTFAEHGQKLQSLKRVKEDEQEEKIDDHIVQTGEHVQRIAQSQPGRLIPEDDIEEVAEKRLDIEAIRDALNSLSWRYRYILERRFGLGVEPATLETLGQEFGISRERVRQIETGSLKIIHDVYVDRMSGIEPRWTAEQRVLQTEWFEELAAKQEAGGIAFVTGSLLERPLPEPLRYYLEHGHFLAKTGDTALKLALRAAA